MLKTLHIDGRETLAALKDKLVSLARAEESDCCEWEASQLIMCQKLSSGEASKEIKDLAKRIDSCGQAVSVTLAPGEPLKPEQYRLRWSRIQMGESKECTEIDSGQLVVSQATTVGDIVRKSEAGQTAAFDAYIRVRLKKNGRLAQILGEEETMDSIYGRHLKDGSELLLETYPRDTTPPSVGSLVLHTRFWDPADAILGPVVALHIIIAEGGGGDAIDATPTPRAGHHYQYNQNLTVSSRTIFRSLSEKSEVPSEALRLAKVLPYQLNDLNSLKYATWRPEPSPGHPSIGGPAWQSGDTLLWVDYRTAEPHMKQSVEKAKSKAAPAIASGPERAVKITVKAPNVAK